MTAKVLDASAVAAMTFLEPTADDVANRVRGHDWFAPSLLKFEMANICRRKIRAAPEDRDMLLAQFGGSLAAPVQYIDIDYEETIVLALGNHLTAYDACYLWLAKFLGCELVTLDGALAKAFAKMERNA